MDTVRISLIGAFELLYTGLILGAGLPIIFAVGVRLLSGSDESAVDAAGTVASPGILSRLLAGLCFAFVALGVVTGIMIIVAAGMGKEVSFENIYPTFVAK